MSAQPPSFPAFRALPALPAFGRGFTMIELIVVIILIAVLAGMTAPALVGSWQAATVRESAWRLQLAAQYARAHAVTRGEECRLVLDVREHRYWLVRELEGRPGEFEPLAGALHGQQSLPGEVRFGRLRIATPGGSAAPAGAGASADAGSGPTAGGYVSFTPAGGADAAMIELTDGRRSWTVRIHASTGRARLMPGWSEQLTDDRIDLDV